MLPPIELSGLFFLLNHASDFGPLSSPADAALDGPAQLDGAIHLRLGGTMVLSVSSDASEAMVDRVLIRLKVW